MSFLVCSILSLAVIFQSLDAFAAAAAVARQRQMQKKAQEEQMIAEYQKQQMIAQQQAVMQQQAQAAQQRAIQQQMMQYQQQQIQAQAQQILMQVQQQKMAYAAQAQAVQQVQAAQMVNAQQMALASSLAVQYQKAVVEEAMKQKVTLDAAKMAQVEQMAQAQAQVAALQAQNQAQAMMPPQNTPMPSSANNFAQVEDTVDISDVWRKLDVNSRAWTLLIDPQAKVDTVSEYIDRFRNAGVRISGSPIQYAQAIDQMATDNPSLLDNAFRNLLQVAAIMEYDFDNGMDKDDLARKFLGVQMYEANRKRLGR